MNQVKPKYKLARGINPGIANMQYDKNKFNRVWLLYTSFFNL